MKIYTITVNQRLDIVKMLWIDSYVYEQLISDQDINVY